MNVRVFSRSSVQPGIPSVHLSVAPRTIRLVRWIQWTLTGMILCAGWLSGWWWWESRTLAEEAARYAVAATRTEELNRQFAAAMRAEQLTLTPQQIAGIKQEVAFINQLADKRAFSWTQLLSDLEDALPPGTSIGKIQLDMKESLVTFDGLAARMQDLNALMASLQSRPAFSHPVLHHHKIVEAETAHGRPEVEGHPERTPAGVEYSLTVRYRRSPKS
jgi:Tfp pilus assembly protein PilN